MSESEGRTPAVTASPGSTVEAGRLSRWPSVTAGICLILAALLTTPAVFAYWGQRTLNDTQRYVATVGPLVDSPQVQDAIATTVTDAIQNQVDVESILNNVFSQVITDRPRLQQLVGPIAAAVNGLIDRQVREFVASQTFRDLWIQLNTQAQQGLQRVLNGEGTGAISLQGDQVVLDLSAVIDQVKEQLVARGLTFAANAPIPNIDKQIVLLDAPKLKQVKDIYAFSNPVAKWLIWVVALLYLGALLLARRKARMTVAIGVALVVNALLFALLLSVGRQAFINQLSGTVFGPASSVFYDTLLTYLVRTRKVLLWVGIILVAVGWYAGAHSSGTAVRRTVAGSLENAGAALAYPPVRPVGVWVGANARWLRPVVGVLGFVVLIWGNDASPQRLFWSGVFVVVLLAFLQVLIGAGRSAPAPAAPDPNAVAGDGPGAAVA